MCFYWLPTMIGISILTNWQYITVQIVGLEDVICLKCFYFTSYFFNFFLYLIILTFDCCLCWWSNGRPICILLMESANRRSDACQHWRSSVLFHSTLISNGEVTLCASLSLSLFLWLCSWNWPASERDTHHCTYISI